MSSHRDGDARELFMTGLLVIFFRCPSIHIPVDFTISYRYDQSKDVIHLLDFGAARDFRPLFTDNYLDLVHAAMEENGDEILRIADYLGFTTGNYYHQQILKCADRKLT